MFDVSIFRRTFLGINLAILAIAFLMASKSSAQEFKKDVFASRVTVELSRNKNTRVEGGDWDDKRDRISFKIKIRNGDPNKSFNDLKMQLFVFAESILNTKAYKLLQREEASFSLAPLQIYEYSSPEVLTAYDKTGARFGDKYKGYYFRICNAQGEVLIEKYTTNFLTNSAGLSNTTADKYYDKNLGAVKAPNPF